MTGTAPRIAVNDGLGAAFQSIGAINHGYQSSPLANMFTLDLAFAVYLSSGLLQKVIDVHASDRTREWRDWQADDEAIQKIEAEEKRLQVRMKWKAAEVLRALGGGAMILAVKEPAGTALSEPIPTNIGVGDLAAINVVSRRHLTLKDVDTEIASATFGEPAMFTIQTGTGPKDLHPSRVIAFRGEPYPAFATVLAQDDLYWGQSRLLRVVNDAKRSDDAVANFGFLVHKAKLLRYGVSGLENYDQATLNARIGLMAVSENMMSATIYNLPSKDANGGETGGEKIDDYQPSWTGIPAMMDSFDQRVASVSDIPFTRLMGRSPAGMNATGESDMNNWYAAVGAAQELEVRPCLEKLDTVLLPSAGVDLGDDMTWRFTPLGRPSPKDEAERFDKTVTALGKVRDMAAMPEGAFNAGVQGVIEQNGWMPGSLQILAAMSEDERFGLNPENDGADPSAIQAEGGDLTSTEGGEGEDQPRRRAANDKATDAEAT